MIAHIVTLSLFIWGFAALFSDGMLLAKAGKSLTEELPQWLCKPLFSCPICMASLHGTLYSLYFGLSITNWILLCFCVCGVNFILNELMRKW